MEKWNNSYIILTKFKRENSIFRFNINLKLKPFHFRTNIFWILLLILFYITGNDIITIHN